MEGADALAVRIDNEILIQNNRVSSLALTCALATIGSATWYMWPALNGDAVLFERIGPVAMLLTASLLLQDLVDYDARSRGRIGVASSLAWPAIAVIGAKFVATESTVQIGHGMMFFVSIACLIASRKNLRGSLDAQRYRGVVTLGGLTIGGAVIISTEYQSNTLMISGTILTLGLISVLMDIFGGDLDRQQRKKFSKKLDAMEMKILQLQADGVKLDQASSLCRNASEVGYKDPEHGFRILAEVSDDIERTIALSEDISEIRKVCAASVADALAIAPIAKKPQRSMDAGDRERDLGSLREAEMLYRRAKKMALKILEYWKSAEDKITEASHLISDLKGSQHRQLHDLLDQAKAALIREDCALALEIAETIPEHVHNLGEASEGASDAYTDAVKILEEGEGLDLSLWEERLEMASKHLEDGDFSLARGLSDSIVREVRKERDAMGDVQRALRQKKKIKQRWKGHDDASLWDERIKDVEAATKRKSWSHAATLLERLTSDLDVMDSTSADAKELLEYVHQEWVSLRKKLDAAGIKSNDEERADCEKCVGDAKANFEVGRIEETLSSLGDADALMEKLRRRV
ncbi:MAG: hypothetical protein VX906_05015 [Candidatus Thermoplasmatota archaeon]|nr:hypothetical protein [Candidatus Thermoplasmatota archaeon]